MQVFVPNQWYSSWKVGSGVRQISMLGGHLSNLKRTFHIGQSLNKVFDIYLHVYVSYLNLRKIQS